MSDCSHPRVRILYARGSRDEGQAWKRDALRCRDCGELLEDDGRPVSPHGTRG